MDMIVNRNTLKTDVNDDEKEGRWSAPRCPPLPSMEAQDSHPEMGLNSSSVKAAAMAFLLPVNRVPLIVLV